MEALLDGEASSPVVGVASSEACGEPEVPLMPRLGIDMPLHDTRPPVRGDVIIAARTVYRVLDSRLVDSPIWDNRWSCQVAVIARSTDQAVRDEVVEIECEREPRPYLFRLRWYRKGEGPAEHFGLGDA